jgi:hypothetical protein
VRQLWQFEEAGCRLGLDKALVGDK